MARGRRPPIEDLPLGRGFSDEPWWWRDVAPSGEFDAAPPGATDILVIGGGYAGLNCARELALGGVDVTVIDARAIGAGASTRNAGLVSGRAGVSKQIDLEAAVGAERAGRIFAEADRAYAAMGELIAAEDIECDLQHVGRFVAAHTPAAYDRLAAKMAEYNRAGGEPFEMVPREAQDEITGSTRYFGGMRVANAGLVHPAKYHAGLLRACRRAGVRFAARTRAEAILTEGDAVRVITAHGDVRAREAVLATNGYTDAAAPWHRRRVASVASSMIATEELPETTVRALFPTGAPIIDTKRLIAYARPSPDFRHVLFGGRASFRKLDPAARRKILGRQMAEMFPDLAGVQATHAWSGRMAFTFDYLPKLGEHGGVRYALGCNGGSGVVLMSWLGRQIAWKILGEPVGDSAFEGLAFQTRPFYSGAPWFLPIIGNWWRLKDRLELARARAA